MRAAAVDEFEDATLWDEKVVKKYSKRGGTSGA
jgi:hypothetical protein